MEPTTIPRSKEGPDAIGVLGGCRDGGGAALYEAAVFGVAGSCVWSNLADVAASGSPLASYQACSESPHNVAV